MTAASAELLFRGGFPTAEMAARVRDARDCSRALETYRFFYPTVSMEAAMQGHRDAGAVECHSALLMACRPRHLLFTGCSDAPYLGSVLDLSAFGPVVVELPAGPYVGIVNDHNSRWIAEIGMHGADGGHGGRYLVVPPEYTGIVPARHHVVRPITNSVLLVVRAFTNDANDDAALDALRRIAIYPLGEAESPPAMRFIDVSAERVDLTPLRWERSLLFWSQLHKVLDEETVVDEFRPLYGMLAALGIEKGRPFDPDARMTAILRQAAADGLEQMLVASFASTREDRMVWPDRKWEWPALRSAAGDFERSTGVDVDARDRWFAHALGASRAMFVRDPSADSLAWLSFRDRYGDYLDGGRPYRLTLPQPVPARQFWSITVYDAQTRSQIRTDEDRAVLRSISELRVMSTARPLELYFGPKVPASRRKRRIKTVSGRGYFVYLRLYGPEPHAFDGSWRPGDFEELVHPSA